MSRLTDNERLWSELRRQGRIGLHSFEIRARLHSGNPSQRIAELEQIHGCQIPRRREKRGGRIGVRYFHPDDAPAGLGDGGSVSSSSAVVEPSRKVPRSRPAASVDETPSLSGESAGAAGLDRNPAEVEQLGLISTPPPMYDDAA